MSKKYASLRRGKYFEIEIYQSQISSGPLLEIGNSKKYILLWHEIYFQIKILKISYIRTTFGRSDVVSRGRRKGLCHLCPSWPCQASILSGAVLYQSGLSSDWYMRPCPFSAAQACVYIGLFESSIHGNPQVCLRRREYRYLWSIHPRRRRWRENRKKYSAGYR